MDLPNEISFKDRKIIDNRPPKNNLIADVDTLIVTISKKLNFQLRAIRVTKDAYSAQFQTKNL